MGNNQNEKNNDFKNQKAMNYIIGNIKINKRNLNQRIINSYENVQREKGYSDTIKGIKNETPIKYSDIYINNVKIKFSYYYNFPKEGNYKIIYIFNRPLISTNYMFYNCHSLMAINLSNFNTQNIKSKNFPEYEKFKNYFPIS